MGQCLKRQKDSVSCRPPKQDKNIDDKRMFKLGVDILNRDFCIQIGYNRKAVKTYGRGMTEVEKGAGNEVPVATLVCETPPENIVS